MLFYLLFQHSILTKLGLVKNDLEMNQKDSICIDKEFSGGIC